MKFLAITFLTILILAMEFQLQFVWILVALLVGAMAFVFLQLRRVRKITKEHLKAVGIDCLASFFGGLMITPFILEQLESREYIKEVSVPTILFVGGLTAFIFWQIRPIYLMWLRSKGLQTDILEKDYDLDKEISDREKKNN